MLKQILTDANRFRSIGSGAAPLLDSTAVGGSKKESRRREQAL